MFYGYEAGIFHGNSVPPRGTDVGGVGYPWTAHLLCFWTVKNLPGFVQIGPKMSMCWVFEIDEMNGLSYVEIDRLIHDSNVLTQ